MYHLMSDRIFSTRLRTGERQMAVQCCQPLTSMILLPLSWSLDDTRSLGLPNLEAIYMYRPRYGKQDRCFDRSSTYPTMALRQRIHILRE